MSFNRHWRVALLLLGAGTLFCAAEVPGRLQLRHTRQICGKQFHDMYHRDACNLIGKRSSQRAVTAPRLPAPSNQERYTNRLLSRLAPKHAEYGAEPHRLYSRWARSVRPYYGLKRYGANARRLLKKRLTRPTKRSPEHYTWMHNHCCTIGCSASDFYGLC